MSSIKKRIILGIIITIVAAALAALLILLIRTYQEIKVKRPDGVVRLVTIPSGDEVYGTEGQSFTITCHGLGDDASKFSNMIWRDSRWSQTRAYSDPGENSLELLFFDPQTEDSGIYKCAVLYDFNVTLETAVRITFNSSGPSFDYLHENVTAEEGSELEINCSASGENPKNYRWYKVASDTMYEDRIFGDVNSNIFYVNYGNLSSFIIRKVDKRHEGLYVCRATNRHDISSKIYELTIVQSNGSDNETDEDLSSILHLNVVNITSNSVEFAMNFSDAVTGIEVKYMDKLEKVQLFASWKYGDKYEVRGLIPGGLYTFRFRTLPSENNRWSRSYQVTLLPDKTEIIFQNVEGGNVTFEWFNKKDDFMRGTIDGYELKYFYVSMVGANEWKPSSCAITTQIPSCAGAGYTIAGLPRRSYYEIQLRAHTVSGYGDPSTQKFFFP